MTPIMSPEDKKRKLEIDDEENSIDDVDASVEPATKKPKKLSGKDDSMVIEPPVKKTKMNKDAVHLRHWLEQNLYKQDDRWREDARKAKPTVCFNEDDGMLMACGEKLTTGGYDISKIDVILQSAAKPGQITRKAFLLNLMCFINKNHIVAHELGTYQDLNVLTYDGQRFLAKINRWKGVNKVHPHEFEQLQMRFGSKWFKIPKWDFKKAEVAFNVLKNLPDKKTGCVEIMLKDVKIKEFEDKDDEGKKILCAMPRFTYTAHVFDKTDVQDQTKKMRKEKKLYGGRLNEDGEDIRSDEDKDKENKEPNKEEDALYGAVKE